MSLDIKVEIAQRLGVDENDLQPVLETVVQRIRQQVAHYGYARLSGLGTFRGRDGALLFEPDPALAETVNLRFAGLEAITLQSSPVEGDASRSDAAQLVTPADEGSAPLPDEQPLSALADEDEDEEEEEETMWQDVNELESEHPLGPLPLTSFEDAEYSILEEEEAEEIEPAELEDEVQTPAEPDEAIPTPIDPHDEFQSPDDSEDDFHGAVEPEPEFEPVDATLGGEPAPAGPQDEPEYDVETDKEDIRPLPELSFDDEGDEDSADESESERAQAEEAAVHATAAAESEEAVREADEQPTTETKTRDREPRAHEGQARDWPSEQTNSDGDDSRGSRRNTWLVVFGVLVLVAAAAVAYFAMQPPRGTEPEIAAETQTEQPAEPPPAADEAVDGASGESVESAAPEEPVGADESPATADAPASSQQPAESTALRGAGGINAAEGGFTIVVFSETSEGSAANVAQRYDGQGFRSDVISSQEGGVTRYRVGVGQFETLEDAMDARNQLAGTQLPADAWVYRLE